MHPELYIHVSWCIWHQGIRIFDEGYPGTMLHPSEVRDAFVNEQYHNRPARNIIKRAEDRDLRACMERTEHAVEDEHHLTAHFNWVMDHQGFRKEFREWVRQGRFHDIRREYSNEQQHNPNARNLLACVSNDMIANLVDPNLVPSVSSQGAPNSTRWTYDVVARGADLILSFTSEPASRFLRVHTQSSFLPYVTMTLQWKQTLTLERGQWVEGLISGRWSRLSDADNRR